MVVLQDVYIDLFGILYDVRGAFAIRVREIIN